MDVGRQWFFKGINKNRALIHVIQDDLLTKETTFYNKLPKRRYFGILDEALKQHPNRHPQFFKLYIKIIRKMGDWDNINDDMFYVFSPIVISLLSLYDINEYNDAIEKLKNLLFCLHILQDF